MAMYTRRSSTESFRQNRIDSPSTSLHRKLSFNPVGEWSPPVQEEPVGAFEVGKGKRILQVLVACIYCLFGAGVVFGFAALKPVLIEQGVYRERCTKEELHDGVWVCYEQELRLNLMFTVAAVSTNVCALPVGTVLDRFGPRVSGIIGAAFLILGALSMAFAADLPFDAYVPGYLFLALGGPFIFISSFQLSNTFPRRSGLILALLTGAFDTSSAVFLAYRLLYENSNGTFTPKKFFLIYLIVPAFVLVVQIFIMPAHSYKTVGELVAHADNPTLDAHDSDDELDSEHRSAIQQARREHRESVVSEITGLLGTKDGAAQEAEEEKKAQKSGVWGALHGKTALQQIMTPWFVLITLFTVLQMLRINYFVVSIPEPRLLASNECSLNAIANPPPPQATIRTQYDSLLHSHHRAVHVNEFFDVALPLGGVISVPFIGLVLDNTSTPFVLALLVTMATMIGVFGVIPDQMWAAYANVCLFVLYRPFYYTAVSDYAAKVFGFATFGKVYGLVICLAGLFNFTQTGLDALTHKRFDNDPIPVNLILLVSALVVGVGLVGYVWTKSRSMQREKLEEEAEGAREVLMPEADAREVGREHGHEGYGTA